MGAQSYADDPTGNSFFYGMRNGVAFPEESIAQTLGESGEKNEESRKCEAAVRMKTPMSRTKTQVPTAILGTARGHPGLRERVKRKRKIPHFVQNDDPGRGADLVWTSEKKNGLAMVASPLNAAER